MIFHIKDRNEFITMPFTCHGRSKLALNKLAFRSLDSIQWDHLFYTYGKNSSPYFNLSPVDFSSSKIVYCCVITPRLLAWKFGPVFSKSTVILTLLSSEYDRHRNYFDDVFLYELLTISYRLNHCPVVVGHCLTTKRIVIQIVLTRLTD